MANIIPAESAEFETAGSTGFWSAWFSCSIAQSTAEANNGTGSMAVTAEASSPAVQDNFLGIQAQSDTTYEVSFAGLGAGPTWDLNLDWRDSGNTVLRSDTLPLTPGASWTTNQQQFTSPTNTDDVRLTITSSGATNGVTYYLDSISIDNEPGGGGQTDGAVSVVQVAATAGGSAVETVTDGATATVQVDASAGGLLSGDVIAGATATVRVVSTAGATITEVVVDGALAEVVVSASAGGPPLAPRDLTIISVGAPSTKWAANAPTTTWTAAAPKSSWKATAPTKRWTATAPTRQDPS